MYWCSAACGLHLFAPNLLCVCTKGHGAWGQERQNFVAFSLDPTEAHRRAACSPSLSDTEVIFGYKLDQSLDGGALPSSLQTWIFVARVGEPGWWQAAVQPAGMDFGHKGALFAIAAQPARAWTWHAAV